MSILDTFYILFDSDASEVKKGTQEAKQSTKQLQDQLKSADQQANRLGQSLLGTVKQFTGLIAGALSVGSIIFGVKSAAEYANTLKIAADYTGANVEELDAWGQATEKAGGSAYYFQYTVQTMTTALKQAATNGTGPVVEVLNELGISLKNASGQTKDFMELLPDLAKAFDGLDRKTSTALGEKLGLDWGTIMLLQKGSSEVDRLIKRQKELGVVTKEDAEVAAKFNLQWLDTTHAFRAIFMTVATAVLPIFTKLGDVFANVAIYIKKHSKLIEGGLIAVGAAITAYILPGLIRTAIASVTAFAPFYAAVAIVTALAAVFALLYEDIHAFLNGHESLIGEILERWPIVGEVVKDVIKFISQAWEYIKSFFADAMKGLDKIIEAKNKIASFLGFGSSDTKVAIEEGKKLIEVAANTPLAAQTSSSILANSNSRNTNTAVNTGPITINTQATDADGIGAALGNSMETQIRQALNNFDDGVLA